MTILVFDIETIPDIESARKLYNLHDLPDESVAEAMFMQRRIKTGHDFLPHHLQRIVAISLLLHTPESLKVWTLGTVDSDEKELLQRFFTGLEKHTPTLVSWNGGGFDLPVLHYRSLLHGISAPKYWETGENIQSFRWNNYLNRFHYRHLDLMDVLAGYQNRANAPLDDISTLLGLPGKMGQSGGNVWEQYLAGDIKGIRDYCETDVLNTYGVYSRFELIRGNLTQETYAHECQRLKDYLAEQKDAPHLTAFLERLSQ